VRNRPGKHDLNDGTFDTGEDLRRFRRGWLRADQRGKKPPLGKEGGG